jgi:hypothetical protein
MSYAIIITDANTGNRLELCRVGSNPEAVARGARRKTSVIGKRRLRAYSKVEVVEIATAANERSAG